MLHVFRKYQRYIFICITVVIILSFSFFGTFTAMQRSSYEDPTAFVAVNGTSVSKSDLDKMALFLGTDADDKRNFGGVWGPNFLNDGVLKKDFFENGAAATLIATFSDELKDDFTQRAAKEKHFSLYKHPQAQFISTQNVWGYFLPGMTQLFTNLQNSNDPMSAEALDARINLYLAEKQFPAAYLAHMLRMQEKQYKWIEHDNNLDYSDLSLFGYHTAQDWFGPRFMRLAAEFIINSSIIAEQRGYVVTKEEALTDLFRNASYSFKQNQQSPHLKVTNANEYFEEQLRRMGIDSATAVKIWQKVMLFRRMFEEMGNSVLTDPFVINSYNAYTKESVEGKLYKLPEEFQFASGRSMEKFEIYLEAIGKKDKQQNPLDLPSTFKTTEELAKSTPELVQKRYLISIANVSKKDLQSKVPIKTMWNWEVEDDNWNKLKEAFPELGTKKGGNRDERFAALESLDKITREKVDRMARAAIVNQHPEWVTVALASAPAKIMTVNIPSKGGEIPFEGVSDRTALMALLDKAPIAVNAESEENHPVDFVDYTGNNQNYYRIQVLDRSNGYETMTFKEAETSGVLNDLLDKKLEAYYKEIREKSPEDYKNPDGSWKGYNDVADSLERRYFNKEVAAIGDYYMKAMAPTETKKKMTLSQAASLRFLKHVQDSKALLQQSADAVAKVAQEPVTETELNKLAARKPLADQWKLVERSYQTARNSRDTTLDKQEALTLKQGEWTKVYTPPNGDLYFFHALEKGNSSTPESVVQQVEIMQAQLGSEAERLLMAELLVKMKKNGNLNLEYLSAPQVDPEE